MWSPKDNALAFMDDNGQLGLWQYPVPEHYPSPIGDKVSAGAVPIAAASDPAALPTAPESAPIAAPDDDIIEETGEAEDATGAAGGRRRLRKVLHDSDDGGFSDHDDDEAAEAALLAQQLKKHGARALAEAAEKGTGAGAIRGAVAALAASAPLGGAAPQGVLQSSSTPAKNDRRFLVWNLTGMVISRDENVFSAIEVDFNDTEKHRTMRLTDRYGFSMAALDDAAVVFGCRANNGHPSTIVYRPLASWAPNSEWQVQLEAGEEALAVALGFKFCAVATSARYMRVFSHTGAQRAVFSVAGPLVTIAAAGGLLALVFHSGRAVGAEDQGMELVLYDMREAARPVRLSSGPLALSEGATLHWVGFSESGVLTTVDSSGVVRSCLRSYGFEWVPILNCAALKKSKAEHHWVVGVTDSAMMCVICKGDDPYPATLPRPVISALPLAIPVACSEPADPTLERERLLCQLLLDEFRAVSSDEGTADDPEVQSQILRGFTKLDSQTVKLIAAACKAERNARALDLATQLQLPKSLTSALKLVNHYKIAPLAERIAMLMEAKYDEGERDVELPPPPTAPPRARARAAPAPEPVADEEPSAHGQAEEEEGDDTNDETQEEVGAEENQAPPSVTNPFAKPTAAPSKGFSALDTGKNTKRKMPITSAVSAKSAKK